MNWILNRLKGHNWSKSMTTIHLGDKARDSVSGFTGVCVARTEWLNGCWRMTLQPQGLDKDGKPQDTQTFDEFQLELIESKQVPAGRKDTGGPWPEPNRASDPVTRPLAGM